MWWLHLSRCHQPVMQLGQLHLSPPVGMYVFVPFITVTNLTCSCLGYHPSECMLLLFCQGVTSLSCSCLGGKCKLLLRLSWCHQPDMQLPGPPTVGMYVAIAFVTVSPTCHAAAWTLASVASARWNVGGNGVCHQTLALLQHVAL